MKKYTTDTFKLDLSDVFLTFGGSMGLYLSIATLANAGDNFLMPKPGFPLSVTIASNLGINVKYYDLLADKDWEIDLKQLESQIDEKTRFIVVNNPSNPTSGLWSK